MAGGATSALGTLTIVDHAGQQPARPVFVDRVTIVGDADYATGGTSGLLAALQAATNDGRAILGAKLTSARLAADDTVLTSLYRCTYDIENDALQVWKGANGAADAEVAAGTDLHTILFEFEITSY